MWRRHETELICVPLALLRHILMFLLFFFQVQMKYPHNYLNHFRRASMLTENKLSNSSYLKPSTNCNTARIYNLPFYSVEIKLVRSIACLMSAGSVCFMPRFFSKILILDQLNSLPCLVHCSLQNTLRYFERRRARSAAWLALCAPSRSPAKRKIII